MALGGGSGEVACLTGVGVMGIGDPQFLDCAYTCRMKSIISNSNKLTFMKFII